MSEVKSTPKPSDTPQRTEGRAEEIEPLTGADDAILDAIWARIAAQGRHGDLSGADNTDDDSVDE